MTDIDIERILSALFNRRNSGIKPGLDNTKKALELLGNPQNRFKSIHVAGTNGKGSTSTFIASILKCSGKKVGLFTSPHILEFRERFKIDGESVSNEVWIESWLSIESLCDRLELTFFEISAVLAFTIFAKLNVDYAVIEVGLGGRLDATNVITPEFAVITPISIDHTDYLGSTLKDIALEKLGIIKDDITTIINGDNSNEVINLANEVSLSKNSSLVVSNPSMLESIEELGFGYKFIYKNSRYEISLSGEFQLSNAIVAIELSKLLNISVSALQSGLESAYISGRFEKKIIDNKTVILDVAHNPMAINELVESLRGKYCNITTVIGMMADKDVSTTVELLSSISSRFIAVSPKISRAISSNDLANIISKNNSNYVYDMGEVDKGVNIGLELVKDSELLLICGSFYTLSEALVVLS